jgi:hypothetical protein
MSQSEIKKYPYTTVDEDGQTKIVVMTTEQADLINKKYRDMEAELNALKTTIKSQKDTIVNQRVIIKTQTDTILKKEIVIKTQLDTITRYSEKVVYVINDKDSLASEYSSLNDSLWKWALSPTLIYTEFPNDSTVYLLDLSMYYMAIDDFGIFMPKMSDKEYQKYQFFIKQYGLPSSSTWKFRNDFRIKRIRPETNPAIMPRKHKGQWNQNKK